MKIVRNNIEIGKWYHGSTMIPQAYCNDKLVFPNIYSDVEEGYDVMCSGTINDYEGTAPEVYVMSVSKWYMRTTGGNYKEYGVYGDNKNDPYVGELVVVDGHEWEYTSSGWVDLGECEETSDYEEYEELEILQTKQAALYDIGYNSSTDISKIWCKYYLTKHSVDISIAQNGAYSLSAGMAVNYFGSINYVGGNYFISGSDRHTNYWQYFSGNSDAEFEYDRDAHTLTFNGTTKTFTAEPTGAATGYTLKIFSPIRNTNPYTINAGDKIYGYKVWNNGTLAVDLVPALRKSDNAMGLYDKVRDMFFTNSAFSVQLNNKVSPSSNVYTKYEYIQGNGTSYIRTNYVVNSIDAAAEIDIEGRKGESHPFGSCMSDNGTYARFKWLYPGSGGNIRYDWLNNMYGVYPTATNRSLIRLDKTGGYLDGVKQTSFSYGSNTFDSNICPIFIFATAQYKSTGLQVIDGGITYNGKIYSVKIYEGETLALDLVPAIKDNVVGMYDRVNNVMYSSYNSTPFTVGGEHEDVGGLVKEYDEKEAPDPIDSGYYTSPDEYLKNNDNYYKKDYVTEIYEGGCEVITTEYVQGAQLTPSYVQGEASDFIVYDGGRYYKNYIYVTPVSTPIATGDYVRGEYIGPADIIISGVTKSSSNFTVKLNNTDVTANIISTSGSNYNYAVYGDLSQSFSSTTGFVRGNTNIITLNIITSGVTTINDSAVRGCTSLESVTLPDSITSIEGYAFTGCRSLKSFVVPSGVTSLTNEAFASCSALTSVTFHNNFRSIGYNTFANCKSLTSVTLPDSLTSIGDYSFQQTGLASITIPDMVNYIQSYAFSGCTSLTTAIIGSGVTSIGDNPFDSCENLATITVDANNTTFDSRDNCNAIIKKSNNYLISGCKNTVIPNNVSVIEAYAFRGCKNLSEIRIPSNVTMIGWMAMKDMPSTVIHIESTTPASIASNTFQNGHGIIYVPVGTAETYKGATNWSSYASRIYEEGTDFSTKIVTGTASGGTVQMSFGNSTRYNGTYYDAGKFFIDAPATATTVGYYSNYKSSTNITSIDLSRMANLTTIHDSAFNGYGNPNMLTSVILPDTVTTIMEYAFGKQRNLTSINIPSSLVTIGVSALQVANLGLITLPSTVTSIGRNAFYECNDICIHIEATTPPTLGDNVLPFAWGLIFVPVGTAATYKAATNWRNYASRIYEEGETPWANIPIKCKGGGYIMGDYKTQSSSGGRYIYVSTYDSNRNSYPTSDLSNVYKFSGAKYNITYADFREFTQLTDCNDAFVDNNTKVKGIRLPSSVTKYSPVYVNGTSSVVDYITIDAVTPPTWVSGTSNGTIRNFYVPDESVNSYKTATGWITYASIIKPMSDFATDFPNE